MVNPARAGMILNISPVLIPALRKPRASGDDPARNYDLLVRVG